MCDDLGPGPSPYNTAIESPFYWMALYIWFGRWFTPPEDEPRMLGYMGA